MSGVAVQVFDLHVSVGNCQALSEVSFECAHGEWTLLAGPSGAGKSTLLRAINGLPPTHGRIRVFDSWIPGRRRQHARLVWRSTGTVMQEVGLFETRTARGNIELALRAAGHDRSACRRDALQWLERLNIGDKAEDYPWRLSGGERQRVALARALSPRPRLLLMDEPTSALDTATAQIVLQAIKELVDGGSTVLMSSHREDEVAELCDRRIELRKGHVTRVDSGPNPATGQPARGADGRRARMRRPDNRYRRRDEHGSPADIENPAGTWRKG
jgi:ABC-type multidrug transport system ATPase subunit